LRQVLSDQPVIPLAQGVVGVTKAFEIQRSLPHGPEGFDKSQDGAWCLRIIFYLAKTPSAYTWMAKDRPKPTEPKWSDGKS